MSFEKEDKEFIEAVINDKVKAHTMSEPTKIEIKNLKQAMKEFKDEVVDFKKAIRKDIKEGFESLDDRFASKTTEKVVYGLVGAILLWALGNILELI